MPIHPSLTLLFVLLPLVGCSSDSAVTDTHTHPPDTHHSAEVVTPTDASTTDTIPTPDVPSRVDTELQTDTPRTTDTSPKADTGVADSSPTADSGDLLDSKSPEDTGAMADTTAATDLATPDAGENASCGEGCPEGTICNGGTCGKTVCGVPELDNLLFDKAQSLASELLMTEQPDQTWAPSKVYTWPHFLQAVYTTCSKGIGGQKTWAGDPNDPPDMKWKYAAVNLAAFLAQSMKETIKYDACDENNWDNVNGYPLAGACGQLGQKYEDYDCEMACPKDPTMQLTAVTNAKWWGAPGPMFCAPDTALIEAGKSADGATGYWNHAHDCWPYPATQPGFKVDETVPAWMRKECEVYVGQKGGKYVFDGSSGSVQGCCWWGRGVIQTTGRCNFGKLNHYLGDTHLDPAKYPAPPKSPYSQIDFCKDPEVICASTKHPELKWIAGLFYWSNDVEPYDVDGWTYTQALKTYVDGGLNGYAFIDAVSGIVNRGCHNPPCETGPVDGLDERRANFEKALKAMGLK